MGGANAHLIVEEPPAILPAGQSGPAGNDVERPLHLFALSAKSEASLMALSSSVEKALADNPALHLADVCHTANLSRSSFPYRIVLPARSKAELREALAAYARDGAARGGRFGAVSADPLGELEVAFLFTGQGSQYPDMGRGLYETQPVFRSAVEHCDQLLRPHLDRSLLSVLYPAPGETSPIAETVYAQPAIFALEYALAQLWISWGIKPAAALGHSVGEYAAACVAGVFSLEDGLRMVADRGRLMQSLSGDGKMAAVFCSEAQAVEALAAFQDSVSIAAVNGPRSVVISGPVEAVDAAIRRLERDGVTTQTLNVSRAFHSRLMDQMLDAFEDSAKTALFSTPRISLISNLTGRPMEPGYVPDARYWRRHARETVRFEAGINALGGQGRRAFIEIGPMPTLINLGRRCLSNASMLWLPSLKQDQDEWLTMTDSLSKLYVNGVKVDWEGFDRPYSRRRVALPTYPFERRRCWVNVVEQEQQDNPTEARQDISATPPRRGESLGILVGFLSNALEADASEIDIHRPFLDMGADSLVMLDAIQTIEERFGVKLEVRQLFEEYNTLDALSRRIDEQAPLAKAPGVNGQPQSHAVSAPNAAPQSQATAPAGLQIAGAWASATSHASSATESHGGLERLMEQQLSAFSQLMAQQLAVLGNRHPAGNGAGAENGTSLLNGVNRAVKDPREIQSPPVAVSRNGSAAAEEREKGGNTWLPYQPLNPGTLEDLNPRQRKYLGAFIEHYVERTQESKRATQFYRSAHADWRASASFRLCTKEIRYPIIGVRSDGSKLWDADGNEYVDYTMGYGVNLFGHGAPFITAALEEQMGKGIHLGPQAELAGEVAALISEITGMERVTFANTGTEAVMAALRLARLATRRNKVVIFAGSYHGTSDGVLVVGRVNDGVHGAAPMVPGIPPGMAEEVIVLNYGSARALEIIRSRANELAAVLVEPVQSRRPDLQPGEFLRELRRVTEEAGVLLIFDEVITGFRILPGGAQAWVHGVRADLASYGKIIGGGMPIGKVVAGRADIMSGIDGGIWRYGDSSMPAANATLYTGTFCKHPLAMAAARAVLNHIKDQGPELYTQLNQRATRLVEALNDYCEEDRVPIQVVQFGSLFRLSGPLLLQSPDVVDLLFYHLIEKGIYVWEGRNWFMSTVHTDADLEAVVRAFKQSVAEMREGGFLPETGSRPSPRGIRANALLGGVDGAGAEKAEPLILPMTETQKQLWFLTQANSEGSESYQQSMAIHLRGPLRLQAMRQAIQQVVDRHEALRTTFDQGEWQRTFTGRSRWIYRSLIFTSGPSGAKEKDRSAPPRWSDGYRPK